MPESNGTRRRSRAWTLANACEVGQLVIVRCQFCRITRHYLPEDPTLLGDVELEQIEKHMRCEGCGHKDYLVVAFHIPTAAERASMRIRRLAGIRYNRKVIWRDED